MVPAVAVSESLISSVPPVCRQIGPSLHVTSPALSSVAASRSRIAADVLLSVPTVLVWSPVRAPP